MKKIFKISTILTVITLSFSTLFAEDFSKLDVKKECDVKVNGIEKVLKTAEKYNKVAISHGVEFMRFGMKASQYIDASKEAIANKQDEIVLVDEKGKATKNKVSLDYAVWRSCSFAISALTQELQSKQNWRLASPSDGYKY